MSATTVSYRYGPEEGEVRWMGDTSTRFVASGDQTGEAFALVDERANRGESVPLHRHEADIESFYVLEGEIAFFLGDEEPFTGGPGSFVHIPGGAVHGFRIESETARYLILTTPRHGRFYRAITTASLPGGGKPGETVDGAQIGAAAREYGIEFVGPLP